MSMSDLDKAIWIKTHQKTINEVLSFEYDIETKMAGESDDIGKCWRDYGDSTHEAIKNEIKQNSEEDYNTYCDILKYVKAIIAEKKLIILNECLDTLKKK